MEVNPPASRAPALPTSGVAPRSLGAELRALAAWSAPLPACALVAATLPTAWIEAYARTIYPHVGWALAGLAGAAPASATELALVACVAGAAWWVGSAARAPGVPRRERGFRTARRIVLLLGLLYAWFLNWGILYHRASAAARWGLDVAGVDDGALRRLATRAVTIANRDGPRFAEAPPESLEAERARIAPLVAELIAARDGARPFIGAPARVPCVAPAIDALGIDGITSPFFREVLMNGALAPPHRACVLAHELAHIAGYAREGEASLVGVLACWTSPDARDRYSAALFLLDDLAEIPLDDGRPARAHLGPDARRDLDAELARNRARRGSLARAMRAANDRYLRAAGDTRGVASYGDAVRLVAAALGED